jgi:uncharacterized membrane protein YqjE
MADPGARQPAEPDHASLGELVSVAVADTSKLIRYELDLAKMELKADAQRLGIGAALFGIAAFFGCLVLVMLSFTYAWGLIAAHLWPWAAYGIVALTWALLGGVAVLIAATRLRGLNALRKTRKTVADDLALIRHHDQAADAVPAVRS